MPYHDIRGYPTVGIGQRIGDKDMPLDFYKFHVPLKVAKLWLKEEVESITKQLMHREWFKSLNHDRQTVIVSMAYQLGVTGLLNFKDMIDALSRKDYKSAKVAALDSKWAEQTPERAGRQAEVLLTGKINGVYREDWFKK